MSVIGAVAISISVFWISQILEKTVLTKKVLSFWGRYSVITLKIGFLRRIFVRE